MVFTAKDRKAILLIRYELADSDNGNVGSSMTNVSAEEGALTQSVSVSVPEMSGCHVWPFHNLVVFLFFFGLGEFLTK